MSQFQILGRRPFPFKAIPIRFAYTNFPDTIDERLLRECNFGISRRGFWHKTEVSRKFAHAERCFQALPMAENAKPQVKLSCPQL